MFRTTVVAILKSKRAVFFSCLLYLFALAIRLHEISVSVPKPDEVHWQWRSHVVYERLLGADVAHATTHLGHPGIVPALVMGGGQMLSEIYNKAFNLTLDDPYYIDLMTAARIANAVVSSLIIPFLYLSGMFLLGSRVALLAACLLLLDPFHISSSRMAHLDSILTLLVTATYFFYVLSLKNDRLSLKFIAAIFWGLSIATKPTAVSLIVVFFVTRYLWITYQRYVANHEKFVFSFQLSDFVRWSDFWFVIVAHVTFASIYTRLWDHFSDYHNRLAIQSRFADIAYRVGSGLYPHRYLVLFSVFVALFIPFYFSRRFQLLARFRGAYLNLSALIIAGVISLSFFPAVIENLFRFWTWVFGLSKEHHKAYGIEWQPQDYGYLSLYWARLTDLDLLLIVLTFFVIAIQVCNKRRLAKKTKENILNITLLFLTIILWTLPLSVSSKQTFRYVLPILPLLYLFSSYGIVILIQCVQRSFLRLGSFKWLAHVISFLLCLLVVGSQAYATVSNYPHYELSFSTISGGLSGAHQRQIIIPSAGEKELIELLVARVKKTKEKVTVGVLGEANALAYFARFHYPDLNGLLNFVPLTKSPFTYSHIAALGTMVDKLPLYLGSESTAFKIVKSYRYKGTELYSLFEVSRPNYKKRYLVPIPLVLSATGKHSRYNGTAPVTSSEVKNRGELVFLVDPQQHRKGFPFFGFETPVLKGDYEVRYTLGIPSNIAVADSLPPEKFVIRIEFGSCQRIVQLSELSNQKLSDISFNCKIAKDSKVQLRAYWFGQVPLIIAGAAIQEIGG